MPTTDSYSTSLNLWRLQAELSWTGIPVNYSRNDGSISWSCFGVIMPNSGRGSKSGTLDKCISHSHSANSLACRGYPLKKIQENNDAEIMDVVLAEARESYASEIVIELTSEGTEDLESNVARIVQWIQAWQRDRTATENSI